MFRGCEHLSEEDHDALNSVFVGAVSDGDGAQGDALEPGVLAFPVATSLKPRRREGSNNCLVLVPSPHRAGVGNQRPKFSVGCVLQKLDANVRHRDGARHSVCVADRFVRY